MDVYQHRSEAENVKVSIKSNLITNELLSRSFINTFIYRYMHNLKQWCNLKHKSHRSVGESVRASVSPVFYLLLPLVLKLQKTHNFRSLGYVKLCTCFRNRQKFTLSVLRNLMEGRQTKESKFVSRAEVFLKTLRTKQLKYNHSTTELLDSDWSGGVDSFLFYNCSSISSTVLY